MALPKAEVHVHLEGSITPDLLRGPARRAGIDPPDAAGIRDLDGLLDVLDKSCRLVTEEAQLEHLAYDFSRRSRAAGVRYADAIVNPTHWPSWQGRLDRFVAALDRGFAAGEHDGHTRVGLCVSIKRSQSRSEAVELAEWLVEHRSSRIVALSIDGNEAIAGRTGPRFAEAFAIAARNRLHRCAHAGESSGPEGVRDAVDLLGAERIDHGVRSIEDPTLVADLARRQIPLGICPTSNLRLGVVASLNDHPIASLRAAGVPVSVNTDDPVLLGTDVVTELDLIASAHSWGPDVLGDLARTSIEASFAPPDLKRALRRELDAYLAGGQEGQASRSRR